MQVRTVKILSTQPATVRFRCAAGTATARWRGELPEVGADTQVEWDIEPQLRWGVNATLAGRTGDSIEDVASEVLVRGRVQSVETDGIITVTVADSPTLLEVSRAPEDLAGEWIELRAPELSLWPHHV
jgi:hypothetical protein